MYIVIYIYLEMYKASGGPRDSCADNFDKDA